jgi:hypothetical protein
VLVLPSPISLLFLVLAFAAWFVGACGMVGYVRWFFAGEFARAREEGAAMSEKKLK